MKPSTLGFCLLEGLFITVYFHACDGSVKILYFFLVQFWKVTLFQERVHFPQVALVLAQGCWRGSPMILCVSVLSAVLAPFSFLILLI